MYLGGTCKRQKTVWRFGQAMYGHPTQKPSRRQLHTLISFNFNMFAQAVNKNSGLSVVQCSKLLFYFAILIGEYGIK